jgi:pyridoxine 5-phosphate synthase
MTKLSVNVNKLATLRNARGKNQPDLTACGKDILAWGAHGLTVHPRPDGRHIRWPDVHALSQVVKTFGQHAEFNIEGYPSREYLDLVTSVAPDQATLVPDPPEALTSNAGWLVEDSRSLLQETVQHISAAGIRVSVFIDPTNCSLKDLEFLKKIGVARIELYTESFADAFTQGLAESVLKKYMSVAEMAQQSGLALNAGHDLNQQNLKTLISAIPTIAEVSIGHALICEALYQGLPTTIGNYLRILGWR